MPIPKERAIEKQAEEAERRIAERHDVTLMLDILRRLSEDLERKATEESVLAGALNRVSEALNSTTLVDAEQGQFIAELLEKASRVSTGLTEYVNGISQPMSDKTLFDVASRAATAFSKIKLAEYKLDAKHYIHIDEVLARKDVELGVIRRALRRVAEDVANHVVPEQASERAYRWLVEQYKGIWKSLKPGRKRAQT